MWAWGCYEWNCGIIRNPEENICETSLLALIHECQGIYKMLKVCLNPYSSGLSNLNIDSNHLTIRKLLILLFLNLFREEKVWAVCCVKRDARQSTCTHTSHYTNIAIQVVILWPMLCIHEFLLFFVFPWGIFSLEGNNCILLFLWYLVISP